MTVEVARAPRDRADSRVAADGYGRGAASGSRTGPRVQLGSVTGVAVVPLWDRFRTGAKA